MPLYSGEALILRTYRLSEADRIVVFLTRERGKKRGVAKGACRTRSRFGGALEPMTRASVGYFEKAHRELVSLNYVEAIQSPLAGPSADALGYVGYFAELLDEWAAEADPNEKLFRLGVAVGAALGQGVCADLVARYFEYWLMRLQGVYPPVGVCPRCAGELAEGAKLALLDRVFVCRSCGRAAQGPDLSGEALAFLRAARRCGPEGVDRLRLSGRAGRELEVAHSALIAVHLEKELKSARVLRALRA